MKALTIWVSTLVLLLGMAFQVQAQTSGFEINTETSLGDIVSEYGKANVVAVNQGASAQVVTITHADGTQTVVYLFKGKAIGLLTTAGVLIVLDLSAMNYAFAAVLNEYGTVQQRVATITGGGDNTASTNAPGTGTPGG